MRRARHFITSLSLACLASVSVTAEEAPVPFRVIESGGTATESGGARSKEEAISVADAEWLQVQFGEFNLGETGRLTIASADGSETQTFTQQQLQEWGGLSAIFNSTDLRITLESDDAEAADVFFDVQEIIAGEANANRVPEVSPSGTESIAATESICGTSDDRVDSRDRRVGRIMPIGCTGWIIGANTFLTAGHCVSSNTRMLQFDVPKSNADGTVRNPPISKQYPIDRNSIVSVNGGTGNDWAVFRVGRNTQTGQLPMQAQGGRFFLSRFANPTNVRVTGYGVDTGRDNQSLQTHAGRFLGATVQGTNDVIIDYLTDTRGGNSGGPVYDAAGSGVAVGIHSHAGCNPPSDGNQGTSFRHERLWNTIARFDRNADIVWRHRNGTVHYWPVDGGQRTGGFNIGHRVSTDWTLAAVGDVNGDRVDDMIWQHKNGQVHYWPMHSGSRQGGINIHTPVSSGWKLVGAGDVNSDGTDDIIWRHKETGQVHFWPMRNGRRTGGINIHTPVSGDWTVQAVGDVDGNGTDDIIWRHRSGQVHFWPMDEGVRQGGRNIHSRVSWDWKLAGAGDVTGDGTDDIVWQNQNGQVHYWRMRGGVRQAGVNMHSPVGGDWTLVDVGDVD